MSNKAKSFLYLVSFIIATMAYHIISKEIEVDPTPQLTKVEVIYAPIIADIHLD